MEVEFVSNASVVIRAGGCTILTDPWYSHGVYYGSWHPFPPLSDADHAKYTGLSPDAIYISHIHPDHLDPETLKFFAPETPIIIGKLPQPHLLRSLMSLGFSDVRELPFGKEVAFKDVMLTVLGPFEGTSEGFVDDVDYAMDTSLIVQDAEGRRVLNVNDNPIKPEDAQALRDHYGRFDIAILPYGGASGYPHAYPQYSDEEKRQRTEALTKRMLDRLLVLGRTLEAKLTLPSAGSYVLGGSLGASNASLHQAGPEEVEAFWRAHFTDECQLFFPLTGDVFDETGRTHYVPDHPYRGYDEESRLAYGLSLGDFRLSHEDIRIPARFRIPWPRLLNKARANLWRMQQRLGVTPEVDIDIRIVARDDIGGTTPPESFCFGLDCERAGMPEDPSARARMTYHVDEGLLFMVITGTAHWNNIEIAPLIEMERQPDVFNPTVHSVMSFFTL